MCCCYKHSTILNELIMNNWLNHSCFSFDRTEPIIARQGYKYCHTTTKKGPGETNILLKTFYKDDSNI